MGLYSKRFHPCHNFHTIARENCRKQKTANETSRHSLLACIVRFHSLLKAMLNIVVGNAIREFGKVLLQCSHNKKKC
jgi:hypothetical protein